MQLAYLFPEYVERMALISSGGLGKEVHPLLRAADPARFGVGAAAAGARVGDPRAGDAVHGAAARLGLNVPARPGRVRPRLRLTGPRGRPRRLPRHDAQRDRTRRPARSRPLDRLYLADQIPFLLIWGSDDPVIPVEHGRRAHDVVAHSHYVEIEGSGHWPMLDAPERVVSELTSFIEETEPFEWSFEQVRERLRRGPVSIAGG